MDNSRLKQVIQRIYYIQTFLCVVSAQNSKAHQLAQNSSVRGNIPCSRLYSGKRPDVFCGYRLNQPVGFGVGEYQPRFEGFGFPKIHLRIRNDDNHVANSDFSGCRAI